MSDISTRSLRSLIERRIIYKHNDVQIVQEIPVALQTSCLTRNRFINPISGRRFTRRCIVATEHDSVSSNEA